MAQKLSNHLCITYKTTYVSVTCLPFIDLNHKTTFTKTIQGVVRPRTAAFETLKSRGQEV